MIDDLNALLHVDSTEVTGLLEEFKPTGCQCNNNFDIKFYHIRFQNNFPRIEHFTKLLCEQIARFCLSRENLQKLNTGNIRKLYLEAKNKFSRPEGNKTGEPGELILFFLLEGVLRVPKIFSKMSLKTNPQMHIHGSDGIHLGINGNHLLLYFGESKLYSIHTTAITEALNSIKEFITPSSTDSNNRQQDFEIDVLSNNLDIPEGELRNRVLDALDPYNEERSNLKYMYTCFIGFDLNELGKQCKLTTFQQVYQSKAESCYKNILQKIEKDPVLKDLSWQFFFIPFNSVDEFRKNFLKELEA